MRSYYSAFRSGVAYYGWLVVAIVFLSSALSIGPAYAFGLFIEPLEDSFGWRRTAISLSLSFGAVGSLTSPLLGRIMDRYGTRPLMAGSLAVMGIGFLLRPLMTELWHWYALSFLQYVAFSGATVLPVGRLVGVWFRKSRGRVMGIATMGNNFGGLTVPLITGFLLASGNWQAAYLILAGLTFLIALLSLAVIRESPDGEDGGGHGDPTDYGQHQGQISHNQLLGGLRLSAVVQKIQVAAQAERDHRQRKQHGVVGWKVLRLNRV